MSKEGVVLDQQGRVVSDLDGKPVQADFQKIKVTRIPSIALLVIIPLLISIFIFFGALATLTLFGMGIAYQIGKLFLPNPNKSILKK